MSGNARLQITLYDALVSINVPGDKARAVLDAMEQEMTSTLATKTDLLQLEDRVGRRIDLLQKDLDHKTDLLRKDLDVLREQLDQRIELLGTSITVRLGSIMVVGLGVLFAALKFT